MATDSKTRARDDELMDDEDIAKQAEKIYDYVSKGWDEQRERTDKLLDLWELYNCELGRYQNYSGMSKIFVPIVRNAVNALVVRYVNQSFPNSGRHVECVSGEDDTPYALLALIEHYIAASKLRTQAATELLTNGQIEGQYNAYFHWNRRTRTVVTRESRPIKVAGIETPEMGELEVTMEETIEDSFPQPEVLHDSDVLVLPATAGSIDEALESGGCVAVMRRWTKAQIEKMEDDGDISEDTADDLIDLLGQGSGDKVRDAERKLANSIGIQFSRGKSWSQVWEVWHKFEVDGERRLCRAFFTGEKKTGSIKLNPNWNDRCPVVSAPVKKVPGIFKGESPVAACKDMQCLANDMINEGADMMYYTLAPIVTVNPQLVTKWKELVADIGAVWPVQPDGVKMFEWPNKIREALEVVSVCKVGIFEALQVNPAMLAQQTSKPGAKRNQAEVALEQQVDLLQTSDAVTNFEEEILTPFVQWAAESDHQYREKEILVREFGDLGMKAGMERIKPIQWGKRWMLKWIGVEAQRNASNIQQIISSINIVKEIPPDAYIGRRLDLAPAIDFLIGVTCGTTLARKVWLNTWEEQTIPVEQENQMLAEGFEVMTHPADDDAKHLQAHMQVPPGPTRDAHIAMHQRAIEMKMKAQMMQQMQQMGMAPNQPGQAGARPRRTAQGGRAGAQVANPRQGFQAPGAIRADSLPKAGALVPPRRAG